MPQPKPDTSYTGSILPLSRDASGLHLAVPESIAAPVRGAIEGGERMLGVGEGGKNPLRPLSPDIMTAAATLGGVPLRAGDAVAKTFARPAAIEARTAGYVLPPAAIREKPGMVASVLAGWSGKIKTAQAASERNQAVTNQLAAKALGLPPDTVLSDKVFNQVRAQAGQAYQDVANSTPVITADHAYDAARSPGSAGPTARRRNSSRRRRTIRASKDLGRRAEERSSNSRPPPVSSWSRSCASPRTVTSKPSATRANMRWAWCSGRRPMR